MVHEVNDSNFEQIIQDNDTVMLDVWAEWCGPCKLIAPVVDDIATQNENVYVGKLNVDENFEVSQKYMIRSIPTILFFKKGELKETAIGFVPKAMLEKKLEQL